MLASLERVFRRVRHIVNWGRTTTAPNDAGNIQTVQLKLSDLQTLDAKPVMLHFGFTSSPPVGSDVVLLAVAGDLANAVIVATNHQPSRPKNLLPGEVQIFDSAGNHIYLRQGGTIEIVAATKIAITAPLVTMSGNLDVNGEIRWNVAGAATHASTHGHSGVQSGSSNTGQPVPGS